MKRNRPPLFERLKKGLEDGIRHANGEIVLKVTEVQIAKPPENFTPEEITQLRHRLKLSQAGFAKVLVVTNKTVQSWEQGQRTPSGSARRLMQLLQKPETLHNLVALPS